MAQFRAQDLLAALATYSKALQAAEALAANDASARFSAAACNLDVAEVLAHNGASDAALAKFRKALDLYRELVRAPQTAVSAPTQAAFEQALAEAAATAPSDLRKAMEAELAAFAAL